MEKEAKDAGETSKARRFNRAIKTLNDFIKKAKAGEYVVISFLCFFFNYYFLDNCRSVDLSDDTIPPEIKIKPKQPPTNDDSSENAPLTPSRPAPQLPPRAPLPDVVQENVTEAKKEIDEELLNMLLG